MSSLFEAREFEAHPIPQHYMYQETGVPSRVAAFVTAFGADIESSRPAIAALQEHGLDVVAYQYDQGVLLEGKPDYLPELVDSLVDDFGRRVAPHSRRRYLGIGLGMDIALTLQRRQEAVQLQNDLDRILPDVFLASGVNVISLTDARPWTVRGYARAFRRNNYDPEALGEAWQMLSLHPSVLGVVAIGSGFDLSYQRAVKRQLVDWQTRGATLEIIELRGLTHEKGLTWFNDHLPSLLTRADQLNS